MLLFLKTVKEEEKPKIKLKRWQKILLRAADALERDGWTTGSYYRNDGAMCALGALAYGAIRLKSEVNPTLLAKLVPGYNEAKFHLLKYIGKSPYYPITYWNDTHDARTVVTTMRKAAENEHQ